MKRKTAVCAFSFMMGILLSSTVSKVHIGIGVGITVVLSLIDVFLTKKKTALSFMAAALSLIIGFGYMNFFEQSKTDLLMPYFDETKMVTAEILEIAPKENNTTLTLKTKTIGNTEEKIKLLTRVYEECPPLIIGQTIEFEAEIKEPDGIYNSGVFYYPRYLKSQGYFVTANIEGTDIKILKEREGKLRYLPYEIRAFVQKVAEKYLSEENAALLTGILLGDDERMDKETEENFQESGIAHLTAVSGLHVSIILMFMMFLFRPIGNKRSAARIFYIFGVLAIIIITGASPSVLRAGIMVILYQLAWILKEDADGITSLGLAGVLILLFNPYGIYDTGFQLSFLATFGILVFANPIMDSIYRKRRNVFLRFLRFFLDAGILSFSAQVVLLPVLIDSFHYIPLLGIFTNILIAPIIPAVIGSGILCILLELIFPPLAGRVALISNLFLDILRVLAEKIANIPFATVPCPSLPILLIVSYGFFLGFLWMAVTKKEKRKTGILLGISILFLCFGIFIQGMEKETVTLSFINVGQGDSTLVQQGETSVLIDGGGSIYSDVGEYILDDFLYSSGVIELDTAIITHFDMDHSGGIKTMIEKGRVRELVVPDIIDQEGEDFIAFAKENGVKIQKLSKGEEMYFNDNFYLECLSPTVNEENENDNNTGLVLLLHANNKKIFFGGDIDEEKENGILTSFPELDVDILKANHHGSKYSNSFSFLSCVSPEFVVISYGKNSYGQPHVETLRRLRQIGAEIFTTKRDGTIIFRIGENGKVYYKTGR